MNTTFTHIYGLVNFIYTMKDFVVLSERAGLGGAPGNVEIGNVLQPRTPVQQTADAVREAGPVGSGSPEIEPPHNEDDENQETIKDHSAPMPAEVLEVREQLARNKAPVETSDTEAAAVSPESVAGKYTMGTDTPTGTFAEGSQQTVTPEGAAVDLDRLRAEIEGVKGESVESPAAKFESLPEVGTPEAVKEAVTSHNTEKISEQTAVLQENIHQLREMYEEEKKANPEMGLELKAQIESELAQLESYPLSILNESITMGHNAKNGNDTGSQQAMIESHLNSGREKIEALTDLMKTEKTEAPTEVSVDGEAQPLKVTSVEDAKAETVELRAEGIDFGTEKAQLATELADFEAKYDEILRSETITIFPPQKKEMHARFDAAKNALQKLQDAIDGSAEGITPAEANREAMRAMLRLESTMEQFDGTAAEAQETAGEIEPGSAEAYRLMGEGLARKMIEAGYVPNNQAGHNFGMMAPYLPFMVGGMGMGVPPGYKMTPEGLKPVDDKEQPANDDAESEKTADDEDEGDDEESPGEDAAETLNEAAVEQVKADIAAATNKNELLNAIAGFGAAMPGERISDSKPVTKVQQGVTAAYVKVTNQFLDGKVGSPISVESSQVSRVETAYGIRDVLVRILNDERKFVIERGLDKYKKRIEAQEKMAVKLRDQNKKDQEEARTYKPPISEGDVNVMESSVLGLEFEPDQKLLHAAQNVLVGRAAYARALDRRYAKATIEERSAGAHIKNRDEAAEIRAENLESTRAVLAYEQLMPEAERLSAEVNTLNEQLDAIGEGPADNKQELITQVRSKRAELNKKLTELRKHDLHIRKIVRTQTKDTRKKLETLQKEMGTETRLAGEQKGELFKRIEGVLEHMKTVNLAEATKEEVVLDLSRRRLHVEARRTTRAYRFVKPYVQGAAKWVRARLGRRGEEAAPESTTELTPDAVGGGVAAESDTAAVTPSEGAPAVPTEGAVVELDGAQDAAGGAETTGTGSGDTRAVA